MTKLIITAENANKVNEVLEDFGYKSNFSFSGDFQLGNIQSSNRYVFLRYSKKDGFYISTTSTWLESDTAETFATELDNARSALLYLDNLDV